MKEFIKIHNISTVVGRIRLLVNTEKGVYALRRKGYKIEKNREGDLEHEYCKHRITEFLRSKGYQV